MNISFCKVCSKGKLSEKKYPQGSWNLFPLDLTGVVKAVTNVFILLQKSSKNQSLKQQYKNKRLKLFSLKNRFFSFYRAAKNWASFLFRIIISSSESNLNLLCTKM